MRTARGTYRPASRERAQVKNTLFVRQSNKLTSRGFVEVHIDPFELQIRIPGVGPSRIDAVLIANNLAQSIPHSAVSHAFIFSQVSRRGRVRTLTRVRDFFFRLLRTSQNLAPIWLPHCPA